MGRVKARRKSSPGKMRRINSTITVERTGSPGKGRKFAFLACVKIGRLAKRSSATCASGRNPRKAVLNALRRHAVTVSRRRGAFAGF